MTEKTNITVKDAAGFQQSISALSMLHGQIDAKLEEGQKLITALQAAASKNVVSSESTVAPTYRGTVAATATAMKNVSTQVTAAKTSVGNVITNLQSILNGVTSIDDDGKSQVVSI